MKKLSIALLASLMGFGLISGCSDDDDSSSKSGIGESCSVADDCESGYCADGKCATAVEDPCKDLAENDTCGENKTCQKDADGKLVCKDTAVEDPCKDLAENDTCGENKTCQKDADGKLVCKDAAVLEDPCKDLAENDACGENKTCQKDADGKLVCKDAAVIEDPCKDLAENDACGEDKICMKDGGDKLVCFPGVGKSCTGSEKLCSNGKYYACEASDEAFVITETDCGTNQICVTSETQNGCFTKCETKDSVRYTCDMESAEDGDDVRFELQLTCSQIDGVKDLIDIQTASKDCGTLMCDTDINRCSNSLTTGETCTKASDCKSFYCTSEKVCADKAENGGACVDDEGCKEGVCINKTCSAKLSDNAKCARNEECLSNKCNDGVCAAANKAFENGADCTNGIACISGYCADGKCAAVPAVPLSCLNSSDCGDGKICNASRLCVEGTGLGYGDSCTDTCSTGLVCDTAKTKKCKTEAEAEKDKTCNKVGEAKCVGNSLLICKEDEYASGDEGYPDLLYAETNCHAGLCNAETKSCLKFCDKKDAELIECDGDNLVTSKCTLMGTTLVFVPEKTQTCTQCITPTNDGKETFRCI